MANTRISDFSAGSAIADTDVFPAVETAGVGPVKKTGLQLKTYAQTGVLLAANNLSDVTAATARTNLGLTALATTAPGTGVATALALNVGSAGAVVVNGGAGGTPSSLTLTNATGLPVGGIAAIGANTFVANGTGGSASPTALSAAAATALLSAMVGDSGSGGTKGLVPAPAAGDAAAAKFLKADGTWAVPAGGGGGGTPGGSTTQIQFNNAGSFAGDAGLAWNNTGKYLFGNAGPAGGLNISGGSGTTQSVEFLNLSTFWWNGANIIAAVNRSGVNGFATTTDGVFAWGPSSTSANTSGATTALYQDGASDTLGLRRGANAQTFRVYNTYTDASNYERGAFKWSGNQLQIVAEAAGTGTTRLLALSGQSLVFAVSAGPYWTLESSGHLRPNGPYDLGLWNGEVRVVYAGTLTLGTTPSQASLTADAANALALRNSTNAQTFNIYNTFTDGSNYERGAVKWDTNVLRIGTEKAGTGTARSLALMTNGTNAITLGTDQKATFAGPVVSSAGYSKAAGSQSFGDGTGGISLSSGGSYFTISGSVYGAFNSTGLVMTSTSPIGWAAGAADAGSNDTTLERAAAGVVKVGNVLLLNGVTFANLPTKVAGQIAYVTDGSTSYAAGANVTAGGGSNKVYVYTDGTNWKALAASF